MLRVVARSLSDMTAHFAVLCSSAFAGRCVSATMLGGRNFDSMTAERALKRGWAADAKLRKAASYSSTMTKKSYALSGLLPLFCAREP